MPSRGRSSAHDNPLEDWTKPGDQGMTIQYQYGVAGGLAVAPTELALRPGGQRTEDFNDLMPPMYASLGVSIGF